MGATKTKQYKNSALEMAKLADALSHPARITIIEILKDNPYLRMTDFPSILGLSWPAVHRHFKKLDSANLIEYGYVHHEYKMLLKNSKLSKFNDFLLK